MAHLSYKLKVVPSTLSKYFEKTKGKAHRHEYYNCNLFLYFTHERYCSLQVRVVPH
jgi:hypothetical protein